MICPLCGSKVKQFERHYKSKRCYERTENRLAFIFNDAVYYKIYLMKRNNNDIIGLPVFWQDNSVGFEGTIYVDRDEKIEKIPGIRKYTNWNFIHQIMSRELKFPKPEDKIDGKMISEKVKQAFERRRFMKEI